MSKEKETKICISDNNNGVIMVNGEQYIKKSSVKFPKLKLKQAQNHPYIIGQHYHIETVTKYFRGLLTSVTENEIILENAAWITSTGRSSEYFKNGALPEEMEPYGDKPLGIGRGSIISFYPMEMIEIVVR